MGWLGDLGEGLMSTAADMDPELARARQAKALLPGRLEEQRLRNQGLYSGLEDAIRERGEKAAAPGAMARIYSAYQPRAATIDRGGALDLAENPEAAGTAAPQTPGRPVARTAGDLFTRGVSPEDVDLASKYRTDAFRALGLVTPEVAEEKTASAKQRSERDALAQEARSLDPKAKDFHDRAFDLAARFALVEHKPAEYVKAITRGDDPVALVQRIRDAMGGEGGPSAADDRIDFEVNNDGKVVIKSKAAKEMNPGTALVKAIDELDAAEQAHAARPTAETKSLVDRLTKRVDRLKSYPVQEGGSVVGAGSRDVIAKGAPKPLAENVVQDVRGIAGLTTAVQGVDKALQWDGIESYIGPYDKWRSTVQGLAPMAALGNVPPEAVDLDQSLARITNATIKLITGAQMSEREADRIKREIPSLGDQPQVFRQKFETTKKNIAQMARVTADLALRGDERAAKVAKDLGLEVPKGGADTAGQSRTVRIRSTADPKRTGTVTLGPGETLPAGVEEIK